jgi:hypothetical protein
MEQIGSDWVFLCCTKKDIDLTLLVKTPWNNNSKLCGRVRHHPSRQQYHRPMLNPQFVNWPVIKATGWCQKDDLDSTTMT